MLIAMCAAIALSSTEPTDFDRWGRKALDEIRRDFYLPSQKLYGETATPSEPPKQVAFNWGVGVMLSALNAGARRDPSLKPWLAEYADAVEVYWNPLGPVPGFDVLPTPKPVDRYYDDNAWMVLSLVETYELLDEPRYLERSKKTLDYVLSGLDDKLGGGIYWRESDKASKNTCSNGPSVAAILAVYKHTKEPRLLDLAKSIYAWTKKNLQDPEDGLYWDNVDLNGKVEKTKWSYNTALMIRSAKGLYAVIQDPSYKADFERMQASSLARWTPEGGAKGAPCDAKFVHLLFESWAYAPRFEAGVQARDAALRWIHQYAQDSQGRFGHRWDRKAEGLYNPFHLIDQASAVRAFYEAARG